MTGLTPTSIEIACLGAMLLDIGAVADATAVLDIGDFYLDSHQRIYAALRRMAKAGKGIDFLTLQAELAMSKELDAVGGPAYIAFLTEGIPRNLNIVSYVGTIRDAGMGRRGVARLQLALADLSERARPCGEILDDLAHDMMRGRVDTTRGISEVLPAVAETLVRPSATTISTGITELDIILRGGWRTKELGIIAAFPSGGKSALVRQTERAAMHKGEGTHAFSIEIADERWLRHHAGRLAGLSSWKTREPHKMADFDKDGFKEALGKMDAWLYRIDDAAGIGIDGLISKAKLSAMRFGTKLFTVDFLQLLIQNARNEVSEITDIVWKLKRFAKDYDVAVVGLSQLTEDRGTGKADGEPRLNQMRGSGAIRQAADVVVLCGRPEDEEGRKTGLDVLDIAKNRDGVTGKVPVRFSADKLEFEARDNG